MDRPGLRLEVQRDAALVGVQVEKRQAFLGARFVVVERRQSPSRVAAGPFDLQYVGPKIGQQLGGIGAGDVVRQINHLDAGQGSAAQNQSPQRVRQSF